MQYSNILSPGTQLHDIYKVEKHISSGGFGRRKKAMPQTRNGLGAKITRMA